MEITSNAVSIARWEAAFSCSGTQSGDAWPGKSLWDFTFQDSGGEDWFALLLINREDDAIASFAVNAANFFPEHGVNIFRIAAYSSPMDLTKEKADTPLVYPKE
jgi:hypothetical protein